MKWSNNLQSKKYDGISDGTLECFQQHVASGDIQNYFHKLFWYKNLKNYKLWSLIKLSSLYYSLFISFLLLKVP